MKGDFENMKIRVGIADDVQYDIDIARVVFNQLLLLPRFEGVKLDFKEFLNPTKEDIIKAVEMDIMLVDIEMPEMNGFEIAELLNAYQPKCRTILVSSHEKYLKSGYKYNPFGFVIKPLDLVDIDGCFVSALKDTIEYGEIILEKEFKNEKFRVSEIVYFKAASKGNKGSRAFTKDGSELLCEHSLTTLEKMYSKQFFRTVRGTLINLSYYDTIDRKKGLVYLTESLVRVHKISTRKVREIDEALRIYRKWKGEL